MLRSNLLAFVVLAGACAEPSVPCRVSDGLELYEQRIAPLLDDARPSSCNSCHLSGIDLDRYASGDPCRTMACMVEEGLVSLEDPESSTILGWISRAQPDSDLITEAVIDEEYEGFKAWIEWSASCGAQACGVIEDPCGPVETPVDDCEGFDRTDPAEAPDSGDPGDCSALTIETLFRDRVYAHARRCFPCHFESENVTGPDWVKAGSCNEASLATMRGLQSSELLDPDNPQRSLLRTKPLAETAGGVPHQGHDKFGNVSDLAYQDIVYWVERWAACRQGSG